MNRVNMDIYAVVEATQELHFGNIKDLNVNRIELATVPSHTGNMEKLYMSPTKVRGVARRTLLWKLNELGDNNVKSCGIPATCGRCALCELFGGLMTTAGGEEGSIASRVFQGGGVSIQEISPEIKQRLSSPTYIINGKIGQYSREDIKKLLKDARGITDPKTLDRLSSPMPYEMEYVEASALFPVYWHCLLLEVSNEDKKMSEPQMVAYSFLESLKRIGAGHPKGAEIYHDNWLEKGSEPLLVVDIYREPLGKRPIISPMEANIERAIECFKSKALASKDVNGKFLRLLGDEAETFLRKLASNEEITIELSTLLKNEES